MPKINREEYEVLKGLDDRWEWIARSRYDGLQVCEDLPMRVMQGECWDDGWGEKYLSDKLFQFIQWKDQEPYNIQELIEEYEDEEYGYFNMKLSREYEQFIEESEETEVKKDIEWLKSAIQQNLDFYNDKDEEWQMAKVRAYAKSLDLINQLDEPEVLSQELPVIPKFVAEWIDVAKSRHHTLLQAMDEYAPKDIKEWVWKYFNSDLLGKAWLAYPNIEVEEEQKYYVLGKHDTPILFRDHRNRITETSNLSDIYPKADSEDFELTEQEIKDYDERYWPFAVKVEELEE